MPGQTTGRQPADDRARPAAFVDPDRVAARSFPAAATPMTPLTRNRSKPESACARLGGRRFTSVLALLWDGRRECLLCKRKGDEAEISAATATRVIG